MVDQLAQVRNKKMGITNTRVKVEEPEDESHQMYLAAMKFFQGRDFKQERSNIME